MIRVLVVEGDTSWAMELAGLIQEAGYAVVGPERSVAEARQALARMTVDRASLHIVLGAETVFPLSMILEGMGTPFAFVTGHAGIASCGVPEPAVYGQALQRPRSVGTDPTDAGLQAQHEIVVIGRRVARPMAAACLTHVRSALAKTSSEAQRAPSRQATPDCGFGSATWSSCALAPKWRKDMDITVPRSANRLLSLLSIGDYSILGKEFEDVALEPRQILETSQSPILHVYFPMSGLASIVGTTHPNHRIEVGMVGHEGMTGLAVVLGDDRSANETVVQSAGRALRIGSGPLRKAMGASPTLTTALLRYSHVFLMQASQTAVANGRGRLNERLARWLLMWHDRLRTGELDVTHEFLSLLLGVRRPGVTVALHELEGQGFISSTRNHVRILDRAGLRRASNGFYGIPEAEYDRTMRVRSAGVNVSIG